MKILDIYKNPLYTLYQWDVNQFVNVVGINPEMPVSVQFWRAGQTEAFVVESTVSGNTVTAAIPNELLREPGELVIYIWQDTGAGEQKGGRTETFFNIPIKERAQPSDYIYDDNVEYISVKTVIEDAKTATTAAQEATEAATTAAKLANDTAEDIKQRADSGEFDGEKGDKGDKGDTGQTPDISINATVNNAVGTPSVSIEKTGTLENPAFNLSFENLKGEQGLQGERGEQGVAGVNGADGKSATITIGTVTTVSPNTPASVTNSGTATDAVFDFEIPKGADGSGGDTDLETLEKIAIKTTIEGNPAMSNSSAEWRIPLIEGYGQSTQGADPTPEAPQEIKDSVVIGIKITDGAEKEQSIALSAPVTLRGIPLESGNITINGQKYLSDYIGQKEGVYGVFRSFFVYEVTGKETLVCSGGAYVEEGSFDAYFNIAQYAPEAKRDTPNNVKWGLCNFLSFNSAVWSKRGEIGFCYNIEQVHIRLKNETISATQEMEISQKSQLLKDYLKRLYDSGTPMIFLYPLATESFEPLPPEDVQALADLKTFYPTSIISWETEDNSGAWTRAEIIHDPANYIDEKLGQITAQQTALQADVLKIGGSV